MIYLRGVKYKFLQNLIDFIHQGEVKVAEEDISDFLEVAEDLKIRGLSEDSLNTNHDESSREVYQNNMEPSPKRKGPEETPINNVNNVQEPQTISPSTEHDNADLEDNNDQIFEPKEKNTMVEKVEKHTNNGHFISVNEGRQFSWSG